MSRPILYTSKKFVRPIAPACLAKYYKLDINVVEIDDDKAKFSQEFPLQRVPAYIEPGGFKLTEAVAITTFLVKSTKNQDEIDKLVGPNSDIKLQADILRWQSFSVSDFVVKAVQYVGPYLKMRPFNDEEVFAAKKELEVILDIYEQQLTEKKYLATDHITLADLISVSCFHFGFRTMFGVEFREKYPNIAEWYNDVTKSAYLDSFFHDKKSVDVPLPVPS